MKPAARDNFASTTIAKLRERVAGRCSNPDCRVPTTGPVESSEEVSRIGVAAHITAAAIGGPRYDGSLSPQQRGAFANGIWLCANHATEIDRDGATYSVSVLREWKRRAEQAAAKEKGQKLPADDDAVKTLVMAMTGTGTKLIPSAPKNVHVATSRALQALDPRFEVESSYVAGMTHFAIRAKEQVDFTITMNPDHAIQFQSQYKALLTDGIDFEVDAASMTMKGSLLLEKISEDTKQGKFGILSAKRHAKQKVWVIDATSNQEWHFDEVEGVVSGGTESYHFDGTACNGIFRLKYRRKLNVPEPMSTLNVSIDFKQWTRRDVRKLLYFGKIRTLFEKLAAGHIFRMALEIDGAELSSAMCADLAASAFANNVHYLLGYTALVRSLCEKLQQVVPFDPAVVFTRNELAAVQKAEQIANGTARYTVNEVKENPVCQLKWDEDSHLMLGVGKSDDVRIVVGRRSEPINVFGVLLKLPTQRIEFTGFEMKWEADAQSLKPGDTVEVEIVRTDSFTLRIDYEI